MKLKITIAKDSTVVHSEEYEISEEGELTTAVQDALSKARAKTRGGPLWGYEIRVDKA